MSGRTIWNVRELDLHVFDGAAECVGDRAVVNRLFAKTEVCQLYMAWKEVTHIHMQSLTILVIRLHLNFIYSHCLFIMSNESTHLGC